MTTVTITTQIRCNRCDQPFSAPRDIEREGFCGQAAARLQDFCTCPHCQQTDAHWLYADDVLPKFEGGFDARKRQRLEWLLTN